MSADLQNPIFNDEDAAREALEAVRWPNGPFCPHCGSVEHIAKVEGKKKTHRPGLYYCNACKGQFTATVGTVFERSKIPLTKWWLATHLLGSSKKGMSAHQLHRMLGVTYKTAWFMAHRIREAMREDDLDLPPIGGSGKVVEADETYYGPQDKPRPRKTPRYQPVTKKGRSGPAGKRAVVALVERGGRVRSFHVAVADKETVVDILRDNLDRETRLMTDESLLYKGSDKLFGGHETVKHSDGEYVRGDVHTNTVENVFSIFKRGMRGVYQHCKEKHLHRYLAEFDFRYNHRTALGVNDAERVEAILKGIEGKRLTYRRPHANLV